MPESVDVAVIGVLRFGVRHEGAEQPLPDADPGPRVAPGIARGVPVTHAVVAWRAHGPFDPARHLPSAPEWNSNRQMRGSPQPTAPSPAVVSVPTGQTPPRARGGRDQRGASVVAQGTPVGASPGSSGSRTPAQSPRRPASRARAASESAHAPRVSECRLPSWAEDAQRHCRLTRGDWPKRPWPFQSGRCVTCRRPLAPGQKHRAAEHHGCAGDRHWIGPDPEDHPVVKRGKDQRGVEERGHKARIAARQRIDETGLRQGHHPPIPASAAHCAGLGSARTQSTAQVAIARPMRS